MENSKKTLLESIRTATISRREYLETVMDRICILLERKASQTDVKRMLALPMDELQNLMAGYSTTPTEMVDGPIKGTLVEQYLSPLEEIDDIDIRNAIRGHLLVADSLSSKLAFEHFWTVANGYSQELEETFLIWTLMETAKLYAREASSAAC